MPKTKWSHSKNPNSMPSFLYPFLNHTNVQPNNNTKTKPQEDEKEQMKAKSEDVLGWELPFCLEPASKIQNKTKPLCCGGWVCGSSGRGNRIADRPARIKWGSWPMPRRPVVFQRLAIGDKFWNPRHVDGPSICKLQEGDGVCSVTCWKERVYYIPVPAIAFSYNND